MNTIKSIVAFNSSYELLEYVFGKEEIETGLSADQICYFKSFEDFEGMRYFLLNDDSVMVCECFSGDSSGEIMKVDDYFRETISWVKENEQ